MSRLFVSVAALAIVASACKKPPPPEDAAEPGAPQAAPSLAKPLDHLAPDELLEGPESAFGIKLPRGFLITRQYSDEVHVEGHGAIGPVYAFFKARLREAKTTNLPRSALFERAKVPTKPGTLVDVRIDAGSFDLIKIVIRDTTPPPPSDQPDEASRRRAAGLSPDGKRLLDPTHID